MNRVSNVTIVFFFWIVISCLFLKLSIGKKSNRFFKQPIIKSIISKDLLLKNFHLISANLPFFNILWPTVLNNLLNLRFVKLRLFLDIKELYFDPFLNQVEIFTKQCLFNLLIYDINLVKQNFFKGLSFLLSYDIVVIVRNNLLDDKLQREIKKYCLKSNHLNKRLYLLPTATKIVSS